MGDIPHLDFSGYDFHPIIDLPEQYHVHDFTKGINPPTQEYSIGRYDEDRKGMYVAELFSGVRTLHVGIDIGAPLNTPVYSFSNGVVFDQKYLPADGDYGNVIITEHKFNGVTLWALYGHLNSTSITHLKIGQPIKAGQIIGWLGDKHENGGWESHVHFQLSLEKPVNCDIPGVVDPQERKIALEKYPDPRLVLGNLY